MPGGVDAAEVIDQAASLAERSGQPTLNLDIIAAQAWR
jgi:hypothetical protein